jgi:hypothetical protein
MNDFQYPLHVIQHIIVPKAENTIALRIEIVGPYRVADSLLVLGVLSTIHLNDKPQLVTGEIREIGSDRCLTTEVRVAKRQSPQMPPELSLRERHVVAKLARTRDAMVRPARQRFD